MWLIDRSSDGSSARRIPLPEPLRAALVRWYAGAGSRHDEDAGITLVQQARIGAKWLACDCLGHDELPPILTPAFLSDAETYYLRRLTSHQRPDHDPRCPFFRDQVTNRITHTLSAHSPADPPTGYFEVLTPAPEKLAQRPDEDGSDDRTRSASVPRLARLLWRLLANSRLNTIPPMRHERSRRSISEEFMALRQAAAAIEIAPGIALDRALWTHGQALHSRRAYAALRALASRWPSGHAPQGFLMLFAASFKGSTVYPSDCEPIRVVNRIQSPSVRENPIKGPYLVIVVVGDSPEERGYSAVRAYAQPVYSGNRFVPITTEFERTLLRALLQARTALEKTGIEIVIDKPVFDRLTPLGSCRPNFLIESRSRMTGEIRQIVIEAVSAASPDTLTWSAGRRSRLEQIAPILAIAPEDLEKKTMLEHLSTALRL